MNQWLIAALGMGTVFIALIFLSLALGGFPLIFRKPEKERPTRVPLPALSSRRVFADPSHEPELVAIIAAAIAATSGMRAGEFRITGISHAESGFSEGFNTPVWGHVERLGRRDWQRR